MCPLITLKIQKSMAIRVNDKRTRDFESRKLRR